MGIAQLGRDQPASLDMDFDAIECAGEVMDGLVGGVQTLQPPRVVAVVEPFGAEQQMEASQRMNQASCPGIRSRHSFDRSNARKGPGCVPRWSLRAGMRFRFAALLLHRHHGPKYQGVPPLPWRLFNRSVK